MEASGGLETLEITCNRSSQSKHLYRQTSIPAAERECSNGIREPVPHSHAALPKPSDCAASPGPAVSWEDEQLKHRGSRSQASAS